MRRAWWAAASLVVMAAAAGGAAAQQAPSIKLSPNQGRPGDEFTVTGSNHVQCRDLVIVFADGQTLTPIGEAVADKAGSLTVAVAVPGGASTGSHDVTSRCQAGGAVQARATFTVVPRPPTTTTTTTTTAPTTTATTEPPAGTTTTVTPTTARAPTTTARVTTTTSPSTTTTTVPGTTTTTARQDGGAALVLDRPSAEPGGRVQAAGEGCDPGAEVVLALDGDEVGRATADEDGRFEAPVGLAGIGVGRHRVEARCGPTLRTTLDVVLASRVETGASTLAVFLFFLLLAGLLVRRRVTR